MLLQYVSLECGLANYNSILKHLKFRMTRKLTAVILFLSWLVLC